MFRSSRLLYLVSGLLFLALCAGGWVDLSAEPRFPPPEFPPGYEKPVVSFPVRSVSDWSSPVWLGAILTFVLTLAASWLALVKKSRRGLLTIALISIAALGFWRQGCVCAVGSIQNISAWLFGSMAIVSIPVLILFVTPILMTLFFGRTFCSGVCPLGAVQEWLCVKWLKVPFWLDRVLSLIPFFYLGLAVWLAACGGGFIICQFDPIVGLFRLNANHSLAVLTGLFVLLSLIIARPYCRYLCPMGAILSVAALFSSRHASITPSGGCVQCKLCDNVCPIDAIDPPTVAPSPSERRRGRVQLAFALLFAVLAPLSGWLLCGGTSQQDAVRFARLIVANHPEVRRARLYFAAPTNDQLDQWSGVWEAKREEARENAEAAAKNSNVNSSAVTINSGSNSVFAGPVAIPTDWQRKLDVREASDKQKKTEQEWLRQIALIENSLGQGAPWFGLYLGLIFAWKWLEVSMRRRHDNYQINPSRCVSCGRCFDRCPEKKLISLE